jgi:glucose-6-phosphate isomerase, archaeal
MDMNSNRSSSIQFVSKVSEFKHRKVSRTLRDLASIFQDQHAVSDRLSLENPMIYEFDEYVTGRNIRDLVVSSCTLFPGKIGNEFHMTRGHFHDPANFAEVYYVHQGEGILLMQSLSGDFITAEMSPGNILYVPPDYFHRSVNIGDEPLTFFGVYSGGTDHNYGMCSLETWIAKMVIQIDGEIKILDNPRIQMNNQSTEDTNQG